MTRTMLGALFAGLLMASAGCLGTEDPASFDAAVNASATADSDDGADAALDDAVLEDEEVVDATPRPVVLHLSADGGLAPEIPTEGSVPMAGSYTQCFVVRPCDVLTFTSSPLAENTLVVPGAISLTLWVEADAPVLPSHTFGFGAWFGSTRAMSLTVQTDGSEHFLPGEPQRVDLTIDASNVRPVVVPAGESFQLYLVSGLLHEETGVFRLLTGGETASSVAFTARTLVPSALRPEGAPTEETLTGTLMLPGFPTAEVRDEEGETHVTHELVVGSNTTVLEITLAQVGGPAQNLDIDFDLYDGEQPLASGHTPHSTESIYLAGPALDGLRGKTLRLVVASFTAVDTPYEVVVRQA